MGNICERDKRRWGRESENVVETVRWEIKARDIRKGKRSRKLKN